MQRKAKTFTILNIKVPKHIFNLTDNHRNLQANIVNNIRSIKLQNDHKNMF